MYMAELDTYVIIRCVIDFIGELLYISFKRRTYPRNVKAPVLVVEDEMSNVRVDYSIRESFRKT